jgi:hypothetical protein
MTIATWVWENVANVAFEYTLDAPYGGPQPPADIRVGLADINAALGQPPMAFINYAQTPIDPASNHFMPDALLAVEDPNEAPTTTLPDGDQQYNGTSATMFQAMIQDIGHALGLGTNVNDPNSIMNPALGPQNLLPDINDITAIQSLYGAPTHPTLVGPAAAYTLFANITGEVVPIPTG